MKAVHTTPCREPKRHLATFLDALFVPSHPVELRLIETFMDEGGRESRLWERYWLRSPEIIDRYEEFRRMNDDGANIFFGVNPRTGNGGTKGAVSECYSLWADFDEKPLNQASRSQEPPPPSIVINSGHGTHHYWLLV